METFWPGVYGMESLPADDRARIVAAVPALATGLPVRSAYGPFARPVLSLRAIRALPDEALRRCGPSAFQACASA